MLPPLLGPATYAVDPAPSGPPYPRWEELQPGEAEAQGVHAPARSVSFGVGEWIHLAPGTLLGTYAIEDRLLGNCYGFAAWTGPNHACDTCGLPVASYDDHCGYFQDVVLEPGAVIVLSEDEPEPPRWEFTAPALDAQGYWSPLWEAAIAETLAHLLAASGGVRLVVGDRRLEQFLGPALAFLTPEEGPTREVVLLDGGPDALVIGPADRRTGAGPPGEIPLYAEVYDVLVAPESRRPLPRVEGWDHEPQEIVTWAFEPDYQVFRTVLRGFPGVREGWLRAAYDRPLQKHPRWA